jgi:hypothetical protein
MNKVVATFIAAGVAGIIAEVYGLQGPSFTAGLFAGAVIALLFWGKCHDD